MELPISDFMSATDYKFLEELAEENGKCIVEFAADIVSSQLNVWRQEIQEYEERMAGIEMILENQLEHLMHGKPT